MGFFSWVILGLIAGVIGKFMIPGRDPGGFFITIIIGIIGAIIGGYISVNLGFGSVSGLNLRSIIIAIGGSIVCLIIFRLLRHEA